jgi:predicted lipoprotein with Yx(FWY)xxD motif
MTPDVVVGYARSMEINRIRDVIRGSGCALVVAGCVWALDESSPAAQQRTGGAAIPMPAGVESSKLPDGTLMFTDIRGMTLYTYLKDTPQQSNCNDGCAAQWPPVVATGAPPSDAWTVVTRTDGSKQWAYRGKPLYGWIKDARPGDLTGEGVANGAWKIAVVDSPPNLVTVHLAHVATTFQDAPGQQGLLATALAEAKIAAQHAALAAKASDNLDAMKMHAGHVMHAVDPGVEQTGPGLGFGVRRAAAGVVEHIQMAAKVPNVPVTVLTLASHVLASSNNTLRRCDEIVAVAQRIRAAATASDVSADVARLNALAQQLTSGLDLNKDGEIGWQTGEGGLLQAQAQMQLILKGEGG